MTSRKLILPFVLVGALLGLPAFAADMDSDPILDALAQSEDDDGGDDDLGDVLGDDEEESTVAEEKEAVRSGRVDSEPGAKDSDLEGIDEADRARRTIKVLQKKNFLKIGRIEFGPHLGFVTNDPFVNRYMGGLSLGYHVTEVFSVEMAATFSPDFGDQDWKSITRQLVIENQVSPDISKIVYVLNATTQFAPIYGKLAVIGGRIIVFDIYGIFGFGLTGTADDMDAIGCLGRETDPCSLTANQVHPSTTMGGGFRVAFSKRFATRVEGRSLSYIETLDGVQLEMKNNFMLNVGATFFIDAGNN